MVQFGELEYFFSAGAVTVRLWWRIVTVSPRCLLVYQSYSLLCRWIQHLHMVLAIPAMRPPDCSLAAVSEVDMESAFELGWQFSLLLEETWLRHCQRGPGTSPSCLFMEHRWRCWHCSVCGSCCLW